MLAVGCQPKEAVTYSVSVKIASEAIAGVPTPDSYTVTLTNTSTQAAVELPSENGEAVFTGVLAGVYNITASATVVNGGSTYIYTGAVKGLNVLDNMDASINATASKESALIFKEIYYSGAKGDGYYFRDQFYEIYNQSNETVYADGLCIAETVYQCYDEEYNDITCTWDIDNADKYVFAEIVWQVPGSGTQYPIKPGESFVIAQWAVDHRAEELSAGMSEVDLSGAEFEAVLKEESTWTGLVLTDNAAPNLKKIINATGYDTPQWLTSVAGSRYILFYPSKPLENDNFILATNSNPDYPTEAREILISDILDGVQSVSDETAAETLGLPISVDAGWISCADEDGAWYKGKSISRKKTGETEDGRPIFQDTNNTTNDFEINTTPVVRRYGVGRPSWNNWAK